MTTKWWFYWNSFIVLLLLTFFCYFFNINNFFSVFFFDFLETSFEIYLNAFNLFFIWIALKLNFIFFFIFNVIYQKQKKFKLDLFFLFQIALLCLLFVPLSNEFLLMLLFLETTNICIFGLLLTETYTQLTFKKYKQIETTLKFFSISSLFTSFYLFMFLCLILLFNHTSISQLQQDLFNFFYLLCLEHLFLIILILALFFFLCFLN